LLIVLGLGVVVLAVVAWKSLDVSDRARSAKAQADTRALANAVKVYRSHMQRLPGSLDDLTQPARNSRGQTLNPLLHLVPAAPAGYTPYRYERRADGTFTVSTVGRRKQEITAP
jgi:type II secretory pathway pseudopilin PulG